jgi:hypothetical protein
MTLFSAVANAAARSSRSPFQASGAALPASLQRATATPATPSAMPTSLRSVTRSRPSSAARIRVWIGMVDSTIAPRAAPT